MKRALLLVNTLLIAVSISACDEDAINSFGQSESMNRIEVDNVHTYSELRSYLEQEYSQIKELPVTAIITSGIDTRVPFKYRLQDGSELTIPIIFTESNQRIVDPDFDLRSLP